MMTVWSWLHNSNGEDPHSAFRNSISSLLTRSIRYLTAHTFRPQYASVYFYRISQSFLNGRQSKRGDFRNSSCAHLNDNRHLQSYHVLVAPGAISVATPIISAQLIGAESIPARVYTSELCRQRSQQHYKWRTKPAWR